MTIVLASDEVEVILESLEYSKQRMRDVTETPTPAQRERLAYLGIISGRLRAESRRMSNESPAG